jgi:hypothetical protein
MPERVTKKEKVKYQAKTCKKKVKRHKFVIFGAFFNSFKFFLHLSFINFKYQPFWSLLMSDSQGGVFSPLLEVLK